MRRQVTTTEVRCDLCGAGTCGNFQAGPLDFCGWCQTNEPCESCGSLPTFPDVQATWAGNCMACWRRAMELPRGKCGALGVCLTWMADGHAWHFCDLLDPHDGDHHGPTCGENWGPR